MPGRGPGVEDVALASMTRCPSGRLCRRCVCAAATGQEFPAGEVLVFAADGSVAARLSVPVGRGRSVDEFLRASHYRVEVRATDTSSPVSVRLGLAVVTDPTRGDATWY